VGFQNGSSLQNLEILNVSSKEKKKFLYTREAKEFKKMLGAFPERAVEPFSLYS